jgi:hypothetical protein
MVKRPTFRTLPNVDGHRWRCFEDPSKRKRREAVAIISPALPLAPPARGPYTCAQTRDGRPRVFDAQLVDLVPFPSACVYSFFLRRVAEDRADRVPEVCTEAG